MYQTRDSIKSVWGERAPYVGDWPVRVDERWVEKPDKWVQSACVLSSNGCGLDIGVKNNQIVGVRGRADDRVNKGRLGPKGLHCFSANSSQDRLTKPLIKHKNKFLEATWDDAMNLIVAKSHEISSKYTAGAIGFYTSGQLFLEEYYTLAMIGKAGLGTPHMDGNTRLCTATADAALKASFGTDGQPGSYNDFDVTDTFFLVGHNLSFVQTVLWSRILDRRAGPKRPKLIVVDPRRTKTAEEADIHLAIKVGTNVALMNGILNLIIKNNQIDNNYINNHTVGFEKLKKTVNEWPLKKTAQVTEIAPKLLEEAAEILGSTSTLVSTVLQGVYQSMQATAAACQVNNLHLIRGKLGSLGNSVFQMNGQPTAQNTRECGANGDMPGFRNWQNPEHIKELAQLWNVHEDIIPHWSPTTHAMEIFRYCEEGSIKMLWISATNPLVSLPNLAQIRKTLEKKGLFVVVQDAFMTETTALADVILPAAIWGEKTGCFTNVDRTVHISHKAVDPPGQARSDFEIFLDYAHRMGFKDKDGLSLIKFKTPEEAFDAWKECSKGRPCDYSGLSYKKLSVNNGIQWPCNDEFPEGKTHLYNNGVFNTRFDYCETFGNDIITGAGVNPADYKANDPSGRAILIASDYQAPEEEPDEDYPFWLTTGRVVYQFHTRTKTARDKELNQAAPESYVQISSEDAKKYNIQDGEIIEVISRRGKVQEKALIGDIKIGTLFIPFHYGYWDNPNKIRAANELTLNSWDPISKQPHFKYAAVRIKKMSRKKYAHK